MTPTDKDDVVNTEKYNYYFDWPQLLGYIHVYKQQITLQLPEISADFDPKTHFLKGVQDINITINNQHIFSTSWLPIHTLSDVYKFKDMFGKAYRHYYNFSPYRYPLNYQVMPYLHNSIQQHFKTPFVDIDVVEKQHDTTIQINTHTTDLQTLEHVEFLHTQIFIGPHLIFCSENTFNTLDIRSFYYVMSYILYTLAK